MAKDVDDELEIGATPLHDTLHTRDGLRITWSRIYHPEWDGAPEAYVAAGLVAWGRSRRLARAEDTKRGVKAYLGVQHYDPTRWYGMGEPVAKFFLSLFLHGKTVTLRTFPTMQAALAALDAFHMHAGDEQNR